MPLLRSLTFAFLLGLPFTSLSQTGTPTASSEPQPTGLLTPAVTEKLLPASVLYKGQLAPVQGRNSGAVRHADGSVTVVSMVDSSGYSSGVREKFQFLLYTEHPLSFAGQTLPSGFYGAGFLQNNTLVVMNVGGKDVLTTATAADPSLKRPKPLQVLASPSDPASFRLYLGRNYVSLIPAK